jgi:hypothetical protein
LDRRAGFLAFKPLKRGNGGGGDPLPFAVLAGSPGLPIEAEELMQCECTFECKRDGRKVGHGFFSFSSSSW